MKWMLLLTAACVMNAQTPRRAPGFSLPDIKLQQHDLADYRGQVVFVDFIQTSCPACQELSNALEVVKAKFGDKVAKVPKDEPGTDAAAVRAGLVSVTWLSGFVGQAGAEAEISLKQIVPDTARR